MRRAGDPHPHRATAPEGEEKPDGRKQGQPVSLPTFACYGHQPVTYLDGRLIVGGKVVRVKGNALEPGR